MEALLAALESTAIAEYLRESRWSYAAVNAAHILGIALLIGSVMPLNLHLLGMWRDVRREPLARVLVPMAITGLTLAATAGVLLFAVRAREYSGIRFLQIKLVLIAAGILSAVLAHRAHGWRLSHARDARLAGHALFSIACWLGALTCGRLIAFADDV